MDQKRVGADDPGGKPLKRVKIGLRKMGQSASAIVNGSVTGRYDPLAELA
jgi:hypothetical protein